MKPRYLIFSLAAVSSLFAACKQEMPGGLDEVEITPSTYVSIPAAGGSATIYVDAATDWYIYGVGGDTKKDDFALPSWFSVSPTSGEKGETVVTFTAPATEGYNAFDLKLVVGDRTQYINVRQGTDVASEATCADVIAGPDGKSFIIKGVCTSIANTTYGNWYINDGTGEVYIYGSANATGQLAKDIGWSTLGIEVGDVVTVQGPKTTYGTTVELVDAKVLNVEKALLTIEEGEAVTVPAAGGEFSVAMTLKGNGPAIEIPEEAKSWITIKGIEVKNGVPDPAFPTAAVPDTTVVTFVAGENVEEAARYADITFTSSMYVEKEEKKYDEDGKPYKETVKELSSTVGHCIVTQNGLSGTATRPYSVAEAIEFALGTTAATTENYYVKGVFVKWNVNKGSDQSYENSGTYGNASFWISEDGADYLTSDGKNDTSKMFEGYQVYWMGGNKWETGDGNPAPGDTVVICGPLTKYGTTAETAGSGAAHIYSLNGYTAWEAGISSSAPLTVAEAIAKAPSTTKYFVKGKFVKWNKAADAYDGNTYGNASFWLSEDGQEYLNGTANDLTKMFEAYQVYWLEGKKWVSGNHSLAAGDEVVLRGQLATYNGTSETVGKGAAYVFSVNGKRTEAEMSAE